MSFTKPQVTIDLEEYSQLLELKKEKSKELNYDLAYSILINRLLRDTSININEVLFDCRDNSKYSYQYSQGGPGKGYCVEFKVTLKTDK